MSKRKYRLPNEFNTTVQPRPYDLYIETPFNSLVDELRARSTDTTPLTDNYVSMNRNIEDMIGKSDDSVAISVTYDANSNTISVVYANGNKVDIPMVDNYLKSAIFYSDKNCAVLTISNNERVVLDLTQLAQKFYTKDEIDTKINEKVDSIDSINWKHYE